MSASFRQRLFLYVLLWLAGTCLRLTILAVPPVVPLLHADLHLSETGIGWLSSLPPMLFAIAAIPGSLLIARFGVIPALLAGMLLTAAGSAARAAIPETFWLYGSTVVMAAGVSIMQPTLPPLVRAWFPQSPGFATAIYTNGLLLGEIFVTAATIPLVLPLLHGSWRVDFLFWTIPVVAAAMLIAVCAPRPGVTGEGQPSAGSRWWPDWKDPLIWRLGLILGSVNTTYFVSNAFLPDYVTAAGRPDLVSPALTALNLGQLPGSIFMLMVAGRLVRRPAAYVVTALASILCLVGIMATSGAWIVLWTGLLGFAVGVALNLALALPPILSAPGDVHRVSAAMFTISYCFPVAVAVFGGWLWDVTHQPLAGWALIVLFQFAVITVASTARRPIANQ